MYNNKKGQAALEFLMTYGWAILAAIIVIGALGSYFYFNQGGSTSIFVNAPFYGVAAAAVPDTVSIEIENKGGETLTSVTANITGQGCTQESVTLSGATTVEIACTGATTGTTFSGDIIITYLRPGSSLPLTSTGSVSTPVIG